MKVFRTVSALGVAATLLAGTVLLAGPASADPVSPGFVAVGSDTLQDSMNALTNGTVVTGSKVRVLGGGNAVGNFDAFGSAQIQTKNTSAYFTRPSGSGEGVKALWASVNSTTYKGVNVGGLVDIARSSSAATVDANGLLLYVPYARDGVAYAYKASTDAAAAVMANLTKDQLNQIYSANGASTISGITIQPRLPQSASGTRQFFLSALGFAKTYSSPAVPTGDNATTGPAENDATVLSADTANVNEIIPFSVASWIAQSNNVAPSTMVSTVQLGTPTGVAPFNTVDGSLVANGAYYSSSFGRDTYLVVEYARVNPSSSTYNAALAKLVSPTGGASSLVDFSNGVKTPGAVKALYGFLPSTATAFRAYSSAP